MYQRGTTGRLGTGPLAWDEQAPAWAYVPVHCLSIACANKPQTGPKQAQKWPVRGPNRPQTGPTVACVARVALIAPSVCEFGTALSALLDESGN